MIPIPSSRKKFLQKTFIHVEAIVVHSTNGHTSPRSKKIFLNVMHAHFEYEIKHDTQIVCVKSTLEFERRIKF